MLRVKVPAGQLDARRAARDRRGLEPLRPRRRRALDAPEHPAPLARARAAPRGLRRPRALRASRPPAAAATPCATSPAARCRASPPTSSSTRRPTVDGRGRPLLRQPRLGEPAAQAQVLDLGLRRPLQRARDQLHLADRDAARGPRGLRGARRRRALVGAADRARARRLRPEGGGERDPRRDHDASGRRISRYRVSRVKARLKFMVDDIGPEGMRERVEARLGRTLERLRAARRSRSSPRHHLGVHPQKQEGLSYIGVPVHLGLDLGRPDDRDRRARRALRRRHPPHPPAELHRHRRSRRPSLDEASARARARSASRSTSTRCAATRSPAPASPTATSRSPRRRRASAR